MKKAAVVLLVLVAVMMIAPAAFAQGGATGEKAPLSPGTLALAAGFGVAIAAGGGGVGGGRRAGGPGGGAAPDPRAAGGGGAPRLPRLGVVGAHSLLFFGLGGLLFFYV